MKYSILLIFYFTLCSAIAQNLDIKEGAYKSLADFRKNMPFMEDVNFKFKPYFANEDILRVKSKGSKLSSKDLKYDIWGIYYDSTLYLNLLFLNKGKDYVRVLEFGRYSLYRTATGKEIKLNIIEELFLRIFFPDQYLWIENYNSTEEQTFVLDLKDGLSKSVKVHNMFVF